MKSESRGSALQDTAEGLGFIKGNPMFRFLLGMIFFNSFFGTAYIMLMPIFAVDILDLGAEGQGLLMSAGGIGTFLTTLRLAAMGNTSRKGLIVIGGAAAFGLGVTTFALSIEFVGSFYLALAIIFFIGISQSLYMISVTTTLQVMVPDAMRGRVMGVHAIVCSTMPLSGMQAGAIASLIGAPFAVAIGGFLVSAFALGPAALNANMRNLGALVRKADHQSKEESPAPAAPVHRGAV